MLTPISLLIMRIGTGGLLIIWGLVRAVGGYGSELSQNYYGGIGAHDMVQLAFGWGEVALGLLVVLGLLRKYTLVLSAVILVGGAFAIWRHFLDPFGYYLFANPEDADIFFFPSITVAGAALALIALRDLDTLALDRFFSKKDA
ncbi:MAG: hypothetical protein HRT63_04310 [Erythrobacter sp.]|nr:hypothetical protein [Erythrobacter sp.]